MQVLVVKFSVHKSRPSDLVNINLFMYSGDDVMNQLIKK